MQEYLMDTEATAEQVATLVPIAGLNFDRTAAVRFFGACAACKSFRPDFIELRFTGSPPMHAPLLALGGVATD